MRINIILIVIASLIALIGGFAVQTLPVQGQNTPPDAAPQKYPGGMVSIEPRPIPDTKWTTIHGHSFDPGVLKGRYAILNFWASWCAPCVVEFPELATFAADHEDVAVVFISNDQEAADIKKFIDGLSTEAKRALKTSSVYQLHDQNARITREVFQTYRLPESYLLDPNGNITAKFIGALTSEHYTRIENLITGE